MKILATALLCITLMSSAFQKQESTCKKIENKELEDLTYSNNHVRIENKFATRVLQGKLYSPDDEPTSDVLVEAYSKSDEKLVRAAACKTGTDGKYYFNQNIDGDYELRFSGKGYKTMFITVTLVTDKNKFAWDQITPITMEID